MSVRRAKKYSMCTLAVQRSASVRVECAYRTWSASPLLIVVGVIPIDLLVVGRQNIFRLALKLGRTEATAADRPEPLQIWQGRWEEEGVGRWIYHFVHGLAAWTMRDHGQIDFYVWQFLMDLHLMGKVWSPQCAHFEEDDSSPTFFAVGHSAEDRRTLTSTEGVVAPDTLVEKMLSNEDAWKEDAP